MLVTRNSTKGINVNCLQASSLLACGYKYACCAPIMGKRVNPAMVELLAMYIKKSEFYKAKELLVMLFCNHGWFQLAKALHANLETRMRGALILALAGQCIM